jgi:type I restriction-modification system DNA methylase subunit
MLKDYLNRIQDTVNKGDAREESYYSHLDSLIKDFAIENGIKKIDVTILPKKTEAGNPDFRVWDGKNHITGYIEAKDPSVDNLDRIEESEQLTRYRSTFPNLILTNFYEFRLYRDSELVKKVTIGRQRIAQKLRTAPPVENEKEFNDLLSTFFSFSLPQVRNARALAQELAKRTRFLRDEVVSIEMADEEKKGKKDILGFYEAFRKYLIGTLTEQSFADLYSQTITYGLFAARTRSDNTFNRELAFRFIPNTIGILRDVFRFISLEDPPKPLQVIVDDIAEVLGVADVNKILQDYYHEGKGKDPIVHFYETFLTAYDPTIREKRGVYYTPEPVVSYIVRSVHQVLKTHFGIADGLAGENVTLLDPAAGTLTFPAEAVKLAVKEFTGKYGNGGKAKFIKNQLLSNYYAFELMMAPYAIGHIKMSFLLEELGYKLGDDERFKLYLTNTLEMEELEQIEIPGLSSLSEESHLAGRIKKEQPILVIIGNPPYSGISLNPSEQIQQIKKGEKYVTKYYWNEEKGCVDKKYTTVLTKDTKKKQKTFIGDILMDYYFVDGNPLGERNPKWLQDDYVKFLRVAQWKIQKAGFGIIGMITNHSYLDNPTFRGMRQSLMNTFNEIYILNLHGNSLKKETTPDGGKDENVFDIRQGTAIALFVRQKEKNGCKVFHSDLYGLREVKYDWLENKDFSQKNYQAIQPQSPYYFFVKRDTEKIKEYLSWKSVNEIFPVNSVGIVTSRDEFVIDFDKNILRNRITQLASQSQNDEIIACAYSLKDTSNWKLSEARKQIQKLENWGNLIEQIQYRPFDNRYIFYHDTLVERTRRDVMRHMLGNNLGLNIVRQVKTGETWQHCLISNTISESCYLSNKTSEIGYVFPLYLYRKDAPKKSHLQSMLVFEPRVEYSGNRTPNIDKKILEKLNKSYRKNPTPEEILYYIYAVFYSNVYRRKYAEFLRIDFPRVPFTKDYDVFARMVDLGNQLADLHLLKGKLLENPISKFQGESENDRIEGIVYDEQMGRIYINKNKYFDGITPEVWGYEIGGYQVLQKYLKDRKGRNMDDSKHYSRVITAISATIELQRQIDEIYPSVESEPIKFLSA